MPTNIQASQEKMSATLKPRVCQEHGKQQANGKLSNQNKRQVALANRCCRSLLSCTNHMRNPTIVRLSIRKDLFHISFIDHLLNFLVGHKT